MTEYFVKNILGKNDNPTNNTNNSKSQQLVEVSVPGSKSITNRALLLGVLSDGKCVLNNVLFSDDSRHFMDCVEKLGFETVIDEENATITVVGQKGNIPNKTASINVGSAGTAARFLTALLGMSKGQYHLDSSNQMKKRPMAPLLETLSSMGTKVVFDEKEGYFPYTLSLDELKLDKVSVNIDTSSQFLSAMLISSVVANDTLNIEVNGTHGMSYIDMTVKMMEQFGVRAEYTVEDGKRIYRIGGEESYKALTYDIEPDVSGAAYFYAIAAILGKSVRVKGVHFDSMQGDIEFIRLLMQMGCSAVDEPEGIVLTGPKPGELKGITADMHACSDQAITMAAVAVYANSPVTIKGIGHIRFQESDRLMAIVNELSRMGIGCEYGEDYITVKPGQPKAARIETYEDHRIAMGFSIVGLRADGIVIDNPLCCAKTFENYFDVLSKTIEKLSNS